MLGLSILPLKTKIWPKKYETALIVGGELPDIAWSVIDSRGEVFEFDMWEPLEQEPYKFPSFGSL